jgi:hypothetical protein
MVDPPERHVIASAPQRRAQVDVLKQQAMNTESITFTDQVFK